LSTRSTSAWVATDQKPSPSGVWLVPPDRRRRPVPLEEMMRKARREVVQIGEIETGQRVVPRTITQDA
jgi:hypothetical protein